MALPTDKIVTLEVNREGILRQMQRTHNKILAAKSLSGAALTKVLSEADKENADAMAELKAAPAPASGPSGAPSGPSGTPTGPSGATGPTGAPSGPVTPPFRTLDAVSDWEGLHFGRVKETMLADRRAIEMAVQQGDGNPDGTHGETRTQLETANFLKEGEEFWVRGAFYLPTSEFTPPPGSWGVNIVENYAAKGNGSPPVSLQAREGLLQYRPFGGATKLLALPLADYLGRWVDYAIGMRWAMDGWVEMHIDDLSGNAPKLKRTNVGLVGGGSEPFGGNMRWIIQNYYSASLGNITLLHENLSVFGHSLAAVL